MESDAAWLDLGRALDIPEEELVRTPPAPAPPAAEDQAVQSTLAAIEHWWGIAVPNMQETYALARAVEEQQERTKGPWKRGPEERIRTVTIRVDMWRTFFRAYLGSPPHPAVAEAVARIEAELDARLAEWTKADPA